MLLDFLFNLFQMSFRENSYKVYICRKIFHIRLFNICCYRKFSTRSYFDFLPINWRPFILKLLFNLSPYSISRKQSLILFIFDLRVAFACIRWFIVLKRRLMGIIGCFFAKDFHFRHLISDSWVAIYQSFFLITLWIFKFLEISCLYLRWSFLYSYLIIMDIRNFQILKVPINRSWIRSDFILLLINICRWLFDHLILRKTLLALRYS